MAKRILKSEKILKLLLADKDQFYVGINIEDYLKSKDLKKYGLPETFSDNVTFTPLAKGPVTKVNLNGKKVRKEPEEKEIKEVLIDFVNKNGPRVKFIRDYNVYVKITLHKFQLNLQFATNKHGQKLAISPKLIFDNSKESNIKNTHTINMFYELFYDFEIYTENLEPAIAFNKKYDFELLPKGEFTDDDVSEIILKVRRIFKDEDDIIALQKRLKTIQEYNPEIKGRGPDGFYGYIVFGFKEKGYVVLESMYRNNASYVFEFEGFESLISKNKQDILTNNLYKKRFYHYDNWEKNIRSFLES